jgi:hypothetical protein
MADGTTNMGLAVSLARPRLPGLGEAMCEDEAFSRPLTQVFQRLVEHQYCMSASSSERTPATAPHNQPQEKC